MTIKLTTRTIIIAAALALGAPAAFADDSATVTYKSLSPEVALEAAQAALKQCRADGFQVAVAVVDRFGQPQVMLRDRYAGLPAADTATSKAYTALSFHAATSDLAKSIKSGTMDRGPGAVAPRRHAGRRAGDRGRRYPFGRHRRLRRAGRRQGRGLRQGRAGCDPG